MGREVRRVPANWQHPKYPDDCDDLAGQYVPLMNGRYAESAAEWDEGWAKWQEGFQRAYGKAGKWEPRDPENSASRYNKYAGLRPSPDDYMPDWPESERTHFMMYENTSEGTPISPAFATPEELAHWLADTGASSFGNITASYEAWLRIANGGWAPSAVVEDGVFESGVSALAAREGGAL